MAKKTNQGNFGSYLTMEEWYRVNKRREYAMEQLEHLRNFLSANYLIGDKDLYLAKRVMDVCKPGQVTLMLRFFHAELNFQKIHFHPNHGIKTLRELSERFFELEKYIQMFDSTLSEKAEFNPELMPSVLKDVENNWKVKKVLQGTAILFHIFAVKCEERAELKEEIKCIRERNESEMNGPQAVVA